MQNRAKTKGLNPLVKESGNVFLMLFGAVAMVGVLGASTMTILKGPVRTMSQVTKQTLAENNAITTARLSISSATIDCDGDGVFEPLEFGAAIPGFTGGGQIPGTLGVSRQDPWGNEYGYCVWDNATVDDGGCGGATQGRLEQERKSIKRVMTLFLVMPMTTPLMWLVASGQMSAAALAQKSAVTTLLFVTQLSPKIFNLPLIPQ